jgi:hypothetical protein
MADKEARLGLDVPPQKEPCMASFDPIGCGIHSRRQFLRVSVVAGSAQLLAISLAAPTRGQASKKSISWNDVAETVHRQLATRQGYQSGDLIAKSEVTAVLDQLKSLGWDVPERDKLLGLFLDDGHFLVQELRTPAGVRFIRGVAQQPIVFDRLDRLSGMPGGQRLIHDMIRLPNGQSFMSPHPTPGFTDLTILLPKQANGKTPRDPNFNKPTGKLYTEKDLLKALEERWKLAKN